METLKYAISQQKSISVDKNSEARKSYYQNGIYAVDKSGITTIAKNVGDTTPGFIYKNGLGNVVWKEYFVSMTNQLRFTLILTAFFQQLQAQELEPGYLDPYPILQAAREAIGSDQLSLCAHFRQRLFGQSGAATTEWL